MYPADWQLFSILYSNLFHISCVFSYIKVQLKSLVHIGISGIRWHNDAIPTAHYSRYVSMFASRFGYPDETYLTRVKEELASKGVTGSS